VTERQMMKCSRSTKACLAAVWAAARQPRSSTVLRANSCHLPPQGTRAVSSIKRESSEHEHHP
jgi:hypothetical protein